MNPVFKQLDDETFIIAHLPQHATSISIGVVDNATRKGRIREAIIGSGKESAIIQHAADGQPETFAQAFERVYHEPLSPKPTGK